MDKIDGTSLAIEFLFDVFEGIYYVCQAPNFSILWT